MSLSDTDVSLVVLADRQTAESWWSTLTVARIEGRVLKGAIKGAQALRQYTFRRHCIFWSVSSLIRQVCVYLRVVGLSWCTFGTQRS